MLTGTQYTVTTLDDIVSSNDGYLSLREALSAAASNPGADTINFAAPLAGGVLELSASSGQILIASDVEIIGPGQDQLIVDALRNSRVFEVRPGTNVAISGMTIKGGGNVSEGGGVLNFGNLTLDEVVVADNEVGGYVWASGGGVSSLNYYNGYAPAQLRLINSTVEGNRAHYGGGLRVQVEDGGLLEISGSTISNNVALDATNNGLGGGLWLSVQPDGEASLTNTTLSANSSGAGGALMLYGSELTIINCTITDNHAEIAGGIANFEGTIVTMHNTIVAGNVATLAAYNDHWGSVGGTEAIPSSYNILGIQYSTIATSAADHSDLINGAHGNKVGTQTSPKNANLSPLDYYGGPTKTHAPRNGSLSINGGRNAVATTFDQRGHTRLATSNGTGPVVDIGAYEVDDKSVFTVTTLEDRLNRSPPGGDLSLREAVANANSVAGLQTIVFDARLFELGPRTLTLTYDGGSDGTPDDVNLGSSLRIDGPGANLLTISGGGRTRHFRASTSWWDPWTISISGLTLENGRADFGGAISTTGANFTIRDSRITGNRATESGGGIFAYGSGYVTIIGSEVSDNTAGDNGGGIYLQQRTYGTYLTVRNSTISGNTAVGWGGGVFSQSDYSPPEAPYSYGYNSVSLANSTITGNAAAAGGGLAHSADSGAGWHRAVNSIVAGNTSSVSFVEEDWFNWYFADEHHNVFGFNPDAATGSNTIVLAGAATAGLAPLDFNGGKTRTHALLPGSAALNAGSNSAATSAGLTQDQRGRNRFASAVNAASPRVDIGAYEASLVVSTSVDESDGNYASGDLSLREALALAYTQSGKQEIEFAPALAGSTIELNPALGELILSSNVDIIGLGHDQLAIDALGASRVLQVWPGVKANVSGLRITGGGNVVDGGGIFNWGNLTLDEVAIVDNEALGGVWAGGAGIAMFNYGGYSPAQLHIINSTIDGNRGFYGGALKLDVANGGVLEISGSTISNNVALTSSGMGEAGGLFAWIAAGGAATITNSTFSGNSSKAGGAMKIIGGSLEIINATITNNHADIAGGYAGGIENVYDAKITMHNTILAGNTSAHAMFPDVWGSVGGTPSKPSSHNILGIQHTSVLATSVAHSDLRDGWLGNQVGTEFNAKNPMLTELGDYGGLTRTHASLPGSIAIDQGADRFGPPLDQRGFADGDATGSKDVGAFEARLFEPQAPRHVLSLTPVEQLTVVAGGEDVDFSINATYAGGSLANVHIVQAGGNNPADLHVTMDPVVSGRANITWDYSAQLPGTYEITLKAFDETDPSRAVIAVVRVEVIADKPPLAFVSAGPQSVIAGEELSLQVRANVSPLEALDLRYALGALAPNGMTINALTGWIHWTPTPADEYANFEVIVVDPSIPERSAYQVIEIDVLPPNVAPTIAGPGSLQLLEGGSLSFTGNYAISVADPDQSSIDPLLAVTIEANEGWLGINTTADIDILVGGGTGARSLLLQGTRSELNLALDDVTFTADLQFHGTAEVAVTVDDLGNGSARRALMTQRSIPITVLPTSGQPDATDAYYSVAHNGVRVGNLLLDANLQRYTGQSSPLVRMLSVVDNASTVRNVPAVGTVQIMTGRGATLTIGRDGSFTYDPTTIPPASLTPGTPLTDAITYKITDDVVAVVLEGTLKFDVTKLFTADEETLALLQVGLVDDTGLDDGRTTDPRIAGVIFDTIPDATSFEVEFDIDAADNYDAVRAGAPPDTLPLTADNAPLARIARTASGFPNIEFDPRSVESSFDDIVGRRVIAYRVRALDGEAVIALSEWSYIEFEMDLPADQGSIRFDVRPRQLIPNGIYDSGSGQAPPTTQENESDPTITGVVHGDFAIGGAAMVFDVTIGGVTAQHTLVLNGPGAFTFDPRTLPALNGQTGAVAINYALRKRTGGELDQIVVDGEGSVYFNYNPPAPQLDATIGSLEVVAEGDAALGGRYWIRGDVRSAQFGAGSLGGEQVIVEFDFDYDATNYDGVADAETTAAFDPEESVYSFEHFVAQSPGPNAKVRARVGIWNPMTFSTLFGPWSTDLDSPVQAAFPAALLPGVDPATGGERQFRVESGSPGVPPTVIGYLAPLTPGDTSSIAFLNVELFFLDVWEFPSGLDEPEPDAIVTTDAQGRFEYKFEEPFSATYVHARSVTGDDISIPRVEGESRASIIWVAYEPPALPTLASDALRLVNESSATFEDERWQTNEPRVFGHVTDDGDIEPSSVRVQIDINGDNTPEATVRVDAEGRFSYSAYSLVGNATIRARIVYQDPFNDLVCTSPSWSEIDLVILGVTNEESIVENLSLVAVDDAAASPLTTFDPTITGQVVNSDGHVGFTRVEIYRVVGGIDAYLATVTADGQGRFMFTPIGLPSGEIKLRARAEEWDATVTDTVEVEGDDWQVGQLTFGPLSSVLTFTLRARAPFKTASITLHSDTGTPGDNMTSNPLLVGTIEGEGSLAGRRIEFQLGDGAGNFNNVNVAIAGTATTDPKGRFRWLPTGLAYDAEHDVRARVAEWNATTGQYDTSSPWKTLHFGLDQPLGLVPQFQNGPTLAALPTPPSTTVPEVTFVGRIRSERDVAGAVVEFDYDTTDGDAFDESTTTDEFGEFAFSPMLLPTGAANVRARIREMDAQGLARYSGWQQIATFTYQPTVNAAPSINGLTHTVALDRVLLQGTVVDAQLDDGFTVDFYLASGIVLGSTEVHRTTGAFDFEISGLISGAAYQVFVRAREPMGNGGSQYGIPASVNFTYLPSSGQPFVSQLQLTQDTDIGGGGTISDGATAITQLSGQIAGTGSLSGKAVSVYKSNSSGGWTQIGSTTTNASGAFTFTMPTPQIGYNRVQALVNFTNGRILNFVYDSDDDSPQALALVAAFSGVEPQWQTSQTFNGLLAQEASDELYEQKRDQAEVARDFAAANAGTSREQARRQADSAYSLARSQAEREYQQSVEAAKQAFLTALSGLTPSQRKAYELDDFIWPDAPDANELVLPPHSALPQPPARPTYDGPIPDFAQNPTYRSRVEAAEQAYESELDSAKATYEARLDEIDDAHADDRADAHATHRDAVSAAYDEYEADIAALPEHDDSSRQGHLNAIRDAWTTYSVAVDHIGEAQEHKITKAHERASAALERLMAKEANEKAQVEEDLWEDYLETEGTQEDWERYQEKRHDKLKAIDKKYAPKYEKVLNERDHAVNAAYRGGKEQRASALHSALSTVYSSQAELAKLSRLKSHVGFSERMNAEHDLTGRLTAAAEQLQIELAEATRVRNSDRAVAGYDRDVREAEAERTRAQAISESRLNAIKAWDVVYNTQWSNYQVDLAFNEHVYRQELAQVAYERDEKYAAAKRDEATELATAEKARATSVASAEKARRQAVSQATKDFRTYTEQADYDRDIELIKHWRARRQASADSNKVRAYAEAEVTETNDNRRDEANNAYFTATPGGQAEWANGWAEGDELARIRREWQLETKTASRDLAIGMAGARNTDDHAQIEAIKVHRKADNKSHHDFAAGNGAGVAQFYATYQIAAAHAQNVYNVAVVTAAGVFAVDEAKAFAKRRLNEAEADGDFDNGEAPLAGQWSVADASDKATYEITEAYDYHALVLSSMAPSLWRTYQLALAASERTRVIRTTGVADNARATSHAAESTAWTGKVVTAELAYAQTVYGESGAYVTRADEIAQAHIDAAEGNHLLSYVTARANAVKDHDVLVARAHLTLFDAFADSDASRFAKLADAWHAWDVGIANLGYMGAPPPDALSEEEREELKDYDAANIERYEVSTATANATHMVAIAQARRTWVGSLGNANVTLASSLASAEADWAELLRTEIITLATGISHAQRDYVKAEAGALAAQAGAIAAADAEHQLAAATIEATHATAINAALSAKAQSDATALGAYEVDSHTQHIQAMITAHGAGSHPAVVAAINRDWQIARRNLRNAYFAAVAQIEAAHTQAVNLAHTSHAQRSGQHSQSFAGQQAVADEQWAGEVAEHDAELYITQETARGDLLVGNVNGRGPVDVAHAQAVCKRDNAIAEARVEWTKAVAKVRVAQARIDNWDENAWAQVAELEKRIDDLSEQTRSDANDVRDDAIAAANAEFTQALKDGRADFAENQGALQIAYVTAMAGAVVEHATDVAAASNSHAAETAQLDVDLASALVLSDFTHTQQVLTAAQQRLRDVTQKEVDFEAGLVGPAALRAGAIAASEAARHLAVAQAQQAEAEGLAAAAPSIDEYKFEAAQAAARTSWIDLLTTGYVAYRESLAQADADLSADLAAVRRARELDRSDAATKYDKDAAGYAGTRTRNSTAVEARARVAATTASGNLAVEVAEAEYDHSVDWVKAWAAHHTTVAAAERDLSGQSLSDATAAAGTKRDKAYQEAGRRWNTDAAGAEYQHAVDVAGIEAQLTRDLAGEEYSYASNLAHAAHARDIAFADAEADFWVNEASVDDVQRQASAEAKADFLTQHYAARATALYELTDGLPDLPWAYYEQARATAERDAWLAGGSASLRAQYVAWQLAVGDAHAGYADERAALYRTAAGATAAAVRNHALHLAGATATQVQNAAAAQNEFETKVADLTLAYRQARYGHEWYSQEAFDATEAYESGYGEADRLRRVELARTSAAFVANSGASYVAQTNVILAAESAFDAAVRQAWYDSPTGDSLESTLAALNYQYDMAEAAVFTGAATALAQSSSGEDYAAWTTFYAARTSAREEDLVGPLAELARRQRVGGSGYGGVNLAAAESAYREGLAAAGRALSLSEAQLEAGQQSARAARQLVAAQAASAESLEADGLPAAISPATGLLGALDSGSVFYGTVIPWSGWLGGIAWLSWAQEFGASPGLGYPALGYPAWGEGRGYGSSDWGVDRNSDGDYFPTGALGYAGPWGNWDYYDAWGGYGVPAWGWGGWNAHYTGVAPQMRGASHKIDVEGAVRSYELNVQNVASGVWNVVSALTPLDEAKATINAVTGGVAIGLTAILPDNATLVFKGIDNAGGGDANWDGRLVRLMIESAAPGAAEFFERYFQLAIASDGAEDAAATLYEAGRLGVPYVDDAPGTGSDDEHFQVLVEIPESWSSFQAAEYVIKELLMDSEGDIGVLYGQWLAPGDRTSDVLPGREKSRDFDAWQDATAMEALVKASGYAKLYIETLATVTDGGSAVMIVHELTDEDYSSAAAEAIFLGPIPNLGAKPAAAIGIKLGGAVVAAIPKAVIEAIQKLPDRDILAFLKLIRKNPDNLDQIIRDAERFLKTRKVYFHGASALDSAAVSAAIAKLDVFGDIQDYLKGLSPADLKVLKESTTKVGDMGEEIVRTVLVDAGYEDLVILKNASNHGVDVIAKLGDGRYAVFEVKTTLDGTAKGLSGEQTTQGVVAWTRERARRAASRETWYREITPELERDALQLMRDIDRNPSNISGNLIKINLSSGQIDVSPWRQLTHP